jgi:four helix bundle protein
MPKTAKLTRGRLGLVHETSGNYANSNSRKYDLEERTLRLAQDVRNFAKSLPRTVANIEDVKQLVRASGSVGANYIEANESLGQKDFIMKIKICRKEAKESGFFLRLLDLGGKNSLERDRLIPEAIELTSIFGAIFRKSV